MKHFIDVPTVDRDIFAVRTGLYYSDCSYVTDEGDYGIDVSKNEQLYIVYAGISSTTISQVEIELTDQNDINKFGKNKKYFSMKSMYLDLLYALEENTIMDNVGIRFGLTSTINRYMEFFIEAGYKPIEELYCLAGLGIYFSF